MKGHLGYVPIQLVQYANQKHLENTLRVYLALKYGSGCGIIAQSPTMLADYSNWLEISERTLRRHLKRLEELKWLSIDSNKVIFLRGYNSLERRLALKFRRRVELHSSYFEKSTFKPFLLGAVIGYYVWLQVVEKLLSGPKIRGSRHERNTPHPLSIRYLAKVTGLGHSELQNRIKVAEYQGFVYKEEKLTKTKALPGEVPSLISARQAGEPFPVIIDGKVYLREPNHFTCPLHYKRFRR